MHRLRASRSSAVRFARVAFERTTAAKIINVRNPTYRILLATSSNRPRQSSVTESALCSRLIPRGEPMCEKCQQLKTDIERYRRIVSWGLDPLTTERLNALIHELEQRKAAIH